MAERDAAPFKSGGRAGPAFFTDIPAGPIAIKNVADIYLYPNTVQIVKVTGAQLREWLERSAGIFNRIDPAVTGEQPLINPGFPAFNFDVIDGVTYRIDVTQASRYDNDGKLAAPGAHRILDLAGGHQNPARVDDVLDAVDHLDEALGVSNDEVARVEPAVAERLVAQHWRRALG